ncbi:MAG: AMP-binding protein [Anaerolineales bacterium]|nr:AMP-binding protein [Anaerolineales bacterium]|tara:strand:- start:815 stop:2215 length:1401 start_codon:yes stop_codon:yes gene_type:complete
MYLYNDLEKYSSNIAIITEQSEQISYKELLDAADSIGSRIKKRCLVFAVCRNCFESVAGYIGVMRAGAVLALISDTIDNILFANLLEAYKPEYIYLPAEKSGLEINCTTVFSYGSYTLLKTDCNIDYTLHDDLALLLSTSGSTGSQKFVRQSYRNINSNAEAIVRYLEITSVDRSITTMPMSYTYKLSIINSHLLQGASIILTEATLMDRCFWETIKENNTTTFGGVPYVYEMLKKLRFGQMNLPHLKYITQAGGKLSRELSVEFADICKQRGMRFYTMYGQTEATARMSYLPWEYARTKAGSIGIAIPGGEFWLEDEKGNVIEKSDTQGELVYKGDNVTLGYAVSCLDLCKGDENGGILCTGDVAKRDTEGFYYIVGRKKRFLKMFGNRVSLDEIEQLVRAAGHDCACAGTDDNMKIYVTTLDDKDWIRRYITKCTGINQSGFAFVHIEEIPRNESGKVLYSALN